MLEICQGSNEIVTTVKIDHCTICMTPVTLAYDNLHHFYIYTVFYL